VLLGWAHVAGGSKAFWADRLVLQATTKTRQQLWQQQHHSTAATSALHRHKTGATCASPKKNILLMESSM